MVVAVMAVCLKTYHRHHRPLPTTGKSHPAKCIVTQSLDPWQSQQRTVVTFVLQSGHKSSQTISDVS